MDQNYTHPVISYIIVTYNSQIHFPELINNLNRCTPLDHEIIIIDNNSDDKEYLSPYKVIYNKDNTYFTSAVNQGLKLIDNNSEYIILINPDVRINKNTVEKLISDTQKLNAGITGSILLRSNLSVQHAGGQKYDTKDINPLELTSHQHLHDKDKLRTIINNYPKKVQWVTGALLLITKQALKVLGELDKSYNHYKSDLEYCLRANEEKINVICSSSIALHFHKKSSKSKKGKLNFFFTKLKYYLARKYFELIMNLKK